MTRKNKEVRSPTYRNCERIMAYLNKNKKPGKMGRGQVKTAIGIVCGSDPRTVKRYQRALVDFGFLKVK